MAVFPLQFFAKEDAIIGFNEAYRSSPLGKKYAGQPKGVYVGFEPSVAGSVLTLSPDPSLGYSVIKVGSVVDPGGMDIVVTSPITLDFVGQPSIDFPLQVLARVSYVDDSAFPTSATLITRVLGSPGVNETRICVVSGPAGSISVAFDPTLGEQDVPIALAGVDFGFMPGGSIEDLQAAADIVNEIVEARIGLDGTVHPALSARIAEDYSGESMASRMAVFTRAFRSNDYTIDAGDESLIVSGSFTEIDRDHEPKITLDGSGSETSEGAIASPNDLVRNVVLVVDATTGYRPVDDATDRRVIFGRLSGPNEETVAGEWQFLNASKDVTATDGNGQATVEMRVGDTILGPDGNYYEIETITDDNILELRTAFQGTSASVSATTIRRWQVELKTLNAGVEEDASLPADATIRFFFPAFVFSGSSQFDWKMALHTAAEREPTPTATTTVPGTVRLAANSALLGSVNIQNAGVLLPGGPFHTINFNAASASVLPTTTVGEVEVIEIGEQGAQGADGASGGPGATGPDGPGFSEINPFEISAQFTAGSGLTIAFSFTKDMGHNVKFISGNIAKFAVTGAGFVSPGGDRVDVLDVSIPTATEGRIEGTFGGTSLQSRTLNMLLSSAGD